MLLSPRKGESMDVNPITLSNLMQGEIYYPYNILHMLSEYKKNCRIEYNIICKFFFKCKKERIKIEQKGK
jgi:hypothetical protein